MIVKNHTLIFLITNCVLQTSRTCISHYKVYVTHILQTYYSNYELCFKNRARVFLTTNHMLKNYELSYKNHTRVSLTISLQSVCHTKTTHSPFSLRTTCYKNRARVFPCSMSLKNYTRAIILIINHPLCAFVL